MASFTSTSATSAPPIKCVYLGHTGAGKTGSLISLAAMGYKLRILDTDRGVEILRDYIHNPKSIYRQARPGLWTKEQADSLDSRIYFETITEGYNLIGSRAVPKGDSWRLINLLLNNWIDSETKEKFGNISDWKPDTILVIDSFSRVCEAAMNFQLVMNQRAVTGPQVGNMGSNDYTAAYKMIYDFLDLLKCDDIKCNIILVCHISFIDQSQTKETRDVRGFPQTLGGGRQVSPKVGQYFNHSLRARSSGSYPTIKREIITNNDENVELKTTAPLKVKQSYPLETGLAEYFLAVRGPLQAGQSGDK